MDYLAERTVITNIFVSERGRQVDQSQRTRDKRSRESERFKDAPLLFLKVEGAISQKFWWPPEAGKKNGTHSPLELPEITWSTDTLILAQ